MLHTHKITVQGTNIVIFQQKDSDYISLTDIARYKDSQRSDYILQNWMRKRSTIEFLGLWEKINNQNFNSIEFDGIKNQSGLNSFLLTPKHWIQQTNAIGIISKIGRAGGSFAHKDIAFEFASWLSAEFKLYLIKEFQRLKEAENEQMQLGWDIKHHLTKINYRIHTDAIKEHLIPNHLTPAEINRTYANEADILNKALFGLTAHEWQPANPDKEGNMRDYASVVQLVCLANLESLNAILIRQGLSQPERLMQLNEVAIVQMRSLLGNPMIGKLKSHLKK